MVSSKPRPQFTSVKVPVPILHETSLAPGTVRTGRIFLSPQDSIPVPPPRSSVAIPTELPSPPYHLYQVSQTSVNQLARCHILYTAKLLCAQADRQRLLIGLCVIIFLTTVLQNGVGYTIFVTFIVHCLCVCNTVCRMVTFMVLVICMYVRYVTVSHQNKIHMLLILVFHISDNYPCSLHLVTRRRAISPDI